MTFRRRRVIRAVGAVALACVSAVFPGTAALGAPATPANTYGPSGPNDPDYAPVERAYAAQGPLACTQNNINNEEHYLYSFEPPCAPNAHDPDGAAGMSVDKAWHTYTTGDPRVVMAYVEAGINWFDPGARDLQNQVYLNTGELPLPEDAHGHTHGTYDLNHDGVVNVQDYIHDPRAHDANHNGYLDPEDLIVAFSNHRDDDHNGFVDDISGWDFYDHQNDPATYDSTYGHSDGQMLQAGAQGNNGFGGVGVCPGCMIMPIKAGAEALDRTDDLAQAWLYACHAGAKVVISVTADLGYSSYMNQAVDYCWRHGVVMAESSNDFDSLDHQGGMFHPFVLPGNGEVPNTYGYDVGGSGRLSDSAINAATTTFSTRSDETSWGTHAMFSAATQGGSTSESTPTVAGAFGLLLSWGEEAADKRLITHPLDAAEAVQVMRATASKITSGSLSWPGTPGDWNDQYGYGRPNLYAAMKAVAANDIPPVAWLTSPAWYAQVDPTRQRAVSVTGHVAEPRSSSYRWVLQWGLTPPRDCSSYSTEPTAWHTIGHGGGTKAYEGVLGRLDLANVPRSFAEAPFRLSKCKQLETNDQYAVTLRLRVTDAHGRLGEDRRSITVRHDAGQLPGFPLKLTPSHPVPGMSIDGTSQPAFADLQGRGDLALVYGDADGAVHAVDPRTRRELPGWPVYTNRTIPDHQYPGIDAGHEPVLAPAAIGDLRHDGRLDVVATSTTGRTYVWDAFGRRLAGWPKTLDRAAVTPAIPRPRLKFTRLPHLGATACPVLVHLTGGPQLDIVQAAWDGDIYAWHPDGSRISGWPVHVNGKALTPPSGQVRIDDAKIDATPAVAYLDGTGRPDLVVVSQYDFTPGAGIQFAGAGNTFAYDSKGRLLPGWPVADKALVVYYGSAQEFITEGSTAPVTARVSGTTDSVAIAPGIFSMTYLLHGDGSTQTVYGPAPSALAKLQAGIADPSQLASGNFPTDTPMTFTTTGAFGRFGPGGGLGYAQAGSGDLSVAAALLLNGSGTAITSWERGFDAASGAPEPGFPAALQGLNFLGAPLVAPVTATGAPAVVDGADSSALEAFTAGGQASGFPKFTTGWTVFSPSAGDALTNGRVDLAVTTREGYLEAWRTAGPADLDTQWWTYHHDEWRTGRYGVDTRPPGTLRDVRFRPGDRSATFVAPGDDWYAGKVAGYRVVVDGRPQPTARLCSTSCTASAGSVVTLTLPPNARHVVVQAYDEAGNVGPAIDLAAANGARAAGVGRMPTAGATLARTGGNTAWAGWGLAAIAAALALAVRRAMRRG